MSSFVKEPKIRPMLREDLPEVMAIERDTQSVAWPEGSFLSEMSNASAYAFVVHSEHRVLGYLVFWIICDEVHLLNLAVHIDFQRQGLGKKLVTFLIDFSRRHGASWIGLEVRRSNHTATALYYDSGFRQKRVRKAYYQDCREDGIVMELELNREPI